MEHETKMNIFVIGMIILIFGLFYGLIEYTNYSELKMDEERFETIEDFGFRSRILRHKESGYCFLREKSDYIPMDCPNEVKG